MFLAIKEMKKEKSRFLLIISIVVLISYLVFFLTGLAYGLATDNRSGVDLWQANKVVLKSGSNANILSSAFDIEKLSDFDGLDVSPINIGRSVAYINGSEQDDQTVGLVLMGLNQDSPAYPKLIDGKLPEKENEVLASLSLRDEDGVDIGDRLVLSMNDREFIVTGFTEESKFNVAPVIYTELKMASAAMMAYVPDQGQDKVDNNDPSEMPIDGEREYGEAEIDSVSSPTPGIPERVSAVLVHDDKALNLSDEFDIYPINDFIKELPGYLAQVLTFGLMIGFLILISTIVLGVFMYIITIQKKQIFGIMKIQGISNGYIAKSVVLQTLIVSFIGVAIGLGLTMLTAYFLPNAVPYKPNYAFYGLVALAIIIISLIGAVFSVKGVSKVDPLEVLD